MRILEVVGLTKRFGGRTALDAVSFTVEEGQVLGLFGPSGAGKTTCVECLSGFLAPDGGRIIFDGREITGESPHRVARAGIGRTFQVVKPFRDLTAAENVLVALEHRGTRGPMSLVRGWRDRRARDRAAGLLDRVGLAAEADTKAGLLPLGMVKRLEMARALALEPRLVLLDEPIGGLSPEEAPAAARVVADLRADRLTVIVVERHVPIAMALVDRALVLDGGALIASGSPERVRSDPRVIAAYRGADALPSGHAGPRSPSTGAPPWPGGAAGS